MTDIKANYLTMSDSGIARRIGEYVRHHRLEQNKTQEEVSQAAGISRSTLSLLEKGHPATIPTLIQVLRVLNRLDVLDSFSVEPVISPLLLAKEAEASRKRARNKIKKQPPVDW